MVSHVLTIFMVDVITICGRWNGHLRHTDYMADVVAIGGRWNSHFVSGVTYMADVIAKVAQME